MKHPIFLNVFVVFNVLLITCQAYCPLQCKCYEKTVICWNKSLAAIPKVSIYTEKINLGKNRIEYLKPAEFSYLRNLTWLSLSDNHLRVISSRAFHGLKRLRSLELVNNRIRKLHINDFQGLIQLRQLHLHLNQIPNIEAGVFRDLTELKSLSLNNNKLQRLDSGVFTGLKKLKFLYLYNNNISHISPDVFQELADLKDLFLQNNKIHHIDSVTFLNKRQLQKLYLQDNNLEGIPDEAFENMTALNFLRLDHNNLKCDCNMLWLVEMLHGSAHLKFEGSCSRPTTVAGLPLARLTQYHLDCRKPVIEKGPSNVTVNFGEDTIFSCIASGEPSPDIKWLYDSGDITLKKTRYEIMDNGTLMIHDTDENDIGFYECIASNSEGEARSGAILNVNMKHEYSAVSTTQEIRNVIAGEIVHITCMTKQIQNSLIKWYKNKLSLETNKRVVLDHVKQDLTILNVTISDVGEYTCVDAFRGSIVMTVKLNVEDYQDIGPRIVIRPEDTDAVLGTTVQLPCEVESDQPVVIEWKKDSIDVDDFRFRISPVGSLIIDNLNISDAGVYQCIAFNDYGQDTASATLRIPVNLLQREDYVNIALTAAKQEVDKAINNTLDYLFNNNTAKLDIHDLFKITRHPNAPAIQLVRAAEIYERTLQKVKEYTLAKRNVTSAAPFYFLDELSSTHLDEISRLSGCTAHRKLHTCSPDKYRSIDGRCNNVVHPVWGSSLTAFRRILPPVYEDGISQPVGWNKDIKYEGYSLPSARLVSTSVISTVNITKDDKITHMVMQWGQWLDHDIDHSLPSVSSQTWDGVNCKKTCDYAAPCFPIDVPADDPRISNRRCIDFIRTSALCGSGITSAIFGQLQVREQVNQLTSYIDASQVYGFEEEVANDLRNFTKDDGLLRVGVTFPGGKPLLPTTGINAMDCRRNLNESTRACFVTGDIRGNEQIGLAAMHTIWMREHNRVAVELKALNPSWYGEKIYQEARKIVGAQMQFITYEQWLPIILGPEGHKELGQYEGYNATVNPSISNVFATAALRFGHTIINPILNRYDENFETIPQGHLLLRHAFFSPWRLVDEGGVDPLLRGMFATAAKLKTPKQSLNSELTEKLFYNAHAVALDLAAINIQRGRDHAIPFYTKWRKFCNMREVDNFEDLEFEITDKEIRDKLKQLYGSVHNIDVWVGGVLEDPSIGGKVGPLFKCLLLEQFRRLRDGDRFWYESSFMFTPAQLREIRKTSLGRVLCENGDNIDTIAENVFFLSEVPDELVSCDEVPSIDLRHWADHRPSLITNAEDLNGAKVVPVGDIVYFTCRPINVKNPIISWYFNKLPLHITENIILNGNNHNLTILKATKTDTGEYTCVDTSIDKISVISSFRLNVEQYEKRPRIVTKPIDTEGPVGTTIQMPCEIDSEHPALVEWKKDGSGIGDDRIRISSAGSLIIDKLNISDAGVYECIVLNDYGHDSALATLQVINNRLPQDNYVNIALTVAKDEIDRAISNTVNYLFNNNSVPLDVRKLFRITRFPNTPAVMLARASEIYERTLQKVKEYTLANRNITNAVPFNYRDELSKEHLEEISRLTGCTAHRKIHICPRNKYRSIDGSCNNLKRPMWGSSLTAFRRVLPPIYEDGFSQPVGWNRDKTYNGHPLPSARIVSTSVISTINITKDDKITHMVMQWGQWLDHDMDHALPSISSQTWDGVNCKKTCDYAAPCFPIDVPANDPRITNRRCIDFIRTSALCGSGMTSAIYGQLQVREQVNQLTSFIDASQVYGFDKEIEKDLRDLTTDNGQLRVGITLPRGKPMLPTIGINAMDCRRNLNESTRPCFVTGDIRGNEQIGLTAMHTIWMREHNRIAVELKILNPTWNGDKIYQETRKIVGAQMQHITYEHWLPVVLGDGYKELGKYSGYHDTINPSISNVFATAALRFGHSMINPILNRYDENFEPIPQGHLLLRYAYFSPWRLVDEGGVDPLLRGMFTTPAKLKTPKQNLNTELTEQLFYSAHAVALDLAAINIQRGRDHALPSYTKYRYHCNMSEIHNFDDLATEISDSDVRKKLKSLYHSVHNIDVWVGGILEDSIKGGKVGPLIKCLLIEQFKRLRDGDRFWYENLNYFTTEQINQIKKTSLARILCDNGDNIDTIADNVFLVRKVPDELVSCEEISTIDLRYWIEN